MKIILSYNWKCNHKKNHRFGNLRVFWDSCDVNPLLVVFSHNAIIDPIVDLVVDLPIHVKGSQWQLQDLISLLSHRSPLAGYGD
jgi:hypothetical protein